MKKVKLMFVSLLTVIISLLCLVGCGTAGKYEAVSYKIGPASIAIENQENPSFVELKGDNTAVVSIDLANGVLELDGTGTWEEKEDKKIVITIEGVPFNATVDGNTLTVQLLAGSVVLEK